MNPFAYPDAAHERRHGPIGYAEALSFRPWLRDEFAFRCVFCLRREQWDRCISLQVEHFLPIADDPGARLDYGNLLYACTRCNGAKGKQLVADPTQTLLAESVSVQTNGELVAHTLEARRLIRQMRLDSPEVVYFRSIWIEIARLAQHHNEELCESLLGFPDDLPDLASLRPPGGNLRPEGIERSYFAQRARGELPKMY